MFLRIISFKHKRLTTLIITLNHFNYYCFNMSLKSPSTLKLHISPKLKNTNGYYEHSFEVH